ncbi:MAG: CPCC family cysteine-rich protein [Chitinophagales bacterium]
MEIKHCKYQCLCCEHYTLEVKPDNTFQLCPVCFWEDDGVQLNDPNYEGGANHISLNQARKNYREFGATELIFLDDVRPPSKEERRG